MKAPRINGLTFDSFSGLTVPAKTPLNSHPITFWAAGLAGEIGEYVEAFVDVLSFAVHAGKVVNLAKKQERDQPIMDAADALDAKMLSEAGDAMFYLDKTLKKRGLTLNQAATAQIHKLDAMRVKGKA